MDGVKAVMPAYCSITVLYDVEVWTFERLELKAKEIIDEQYVVKGFPAGDKYYIPVCYDEEYGLDWEEVEQQTNKTRIEIIELHTATVFQVYMMGFLPGFMYLGTLPDDIKCARKLKPRLKVPKGSVAIAGLQTGVYPSDGPGGWQIIGATPVTIWDTEQTETPLIKTGDAVQFYEVSDQFYKTHLGEPLNLSVRHA